MRLFRIVYLLFSGQKATVRIDHGDRCIYVDPSASPFEQEVCLYEAVSQLNRRRARRAGAVVRQLLEHPV
jgi:hypothetical protein